MTEIWTNTRVPNERTYTKSYTDTCKCNFSFVLSFYNVAHNSGKRLGSVFFPVKNDWRFIAKYKNVFSGISKRLWAAADTCARPKWYNNSDNNIMRPFLFFIFRSRTLLCTRRATQPCGSSMEP